MPKAKKSTPKSLKARQQGLRRKLAQGGYELEDVILEMAESGLLAEAGRAAMREHLAAGRPVTYSEGNDIIRRYPDGRREVIGTVPPAPPYKRPKGVRLIRNPELPDV